MEKKPKSFDQLLHEFVYSICPYLSQDELKAEEQRFKDYLDLVWDIYHEHNGGFDREEK